jgi:cation-transporting P-type ATPase C
MSLFPFLAGTCLLAVFTGQALTALEVLWVTALSLLLEDSVAEKSRREIREVIQVTVKDALILVEGKEMRTPAGQLRSGDTVVIYPGEKIPVDGTVIQGEGLVDESHITGRSEPEFRTAEHRVYAGTRLQQGRLYLRAEEVGEDTYLRRILRMVDESLAKRAPAEQRADFLARRLVRMGFWATAVTYVLTGQAFRAFTVLLVVACPCATALAASTAVAAALANAARHRCLIKGGLYLEKIGEADCFCFDKTGTLTSDIPRVAQVVPRASKMAPEKVLFLAAAAENQNPHPLARAIVEEAARRGFSPSPPSSSEFVLGKGVRAAVGKDTVLVGNEGYMEEKGVDVAPFQKRARQLMESGHTAVYVAKNGKAQGLIGVANPLRSGSAEVMDWLRRDGVQALCLVSGDTEPVARRIFRELGMDDCRAPLRPEEKSGYVEELRRRGRRVVMVGDGVNDALALARAEIGIAMGAGGSEVAVEAADIALADNDFNRLIRLRQLSRQTLRVIEQNHWLAMSTNGLGILLAAAGRLSPLTAGLFHVVHTLGIMLNSRRLLRWGPAEGKEVLTS